VGLQLLPLWYSPVQPSHPGASLVLFLALNLVLSSTLAIPYALLQRQLRFAALVKVNFFGAVVGSGVAIISAVSRFGVWSLVAQSLAGTGAMSVLIFTVARWHPRWEFSWPSLQGVIRFGSGLFGSSLLNYYGRNAYNFLIGRFLGATALGFYSMAYQLMVFPLSQVSSAVGKVTYPIMVDLRDDWISTDASISKAARSLPSLHFR